MSGGLELKSFRDYSASFYVKFKHYIQLSSGNAACWSCFQLLLYQARSKSFMSQVSATLKSEQRTKAANAERLHRMHTRVHSERWKLIQ
jgi:hypothetical protein